MNSKLLAELLGFLPLNARVALGIAPNTATIRATQDKIQTVLAQGTSTIRTAVNSELDTIRTTIRMASARLEDLAATGALEAGDAKFLDDARAGIKKALSHV